MQETLPTGDYVPGNCNIGAVEIKRRYRIGYIGLVLAIIFIIYAETFRIPQTYKLIVFAPTAYALSGFLQAWQKFCFVYGFFGLFSFSGKRIRVRDDLQLKKDRSKAIWLITQIFIGSLLVTLAYYSLT